VSGKRLFWLSIIIVELVLGYLLWKPQRDRSLRASHRTPPVPSVVQPPEVKRSEGKRSPILVEARKPAKIPRVHGPSRKMSLVVNAGLKSPEPISTKPSSIAPRTLSPLDSFWCHISMMDSTCDCKGKTDERAAANLVTPQN